MPAVCFPDAAFPVEPLPPRSMGYLRAQSTPPAIQSWVLAGCTLIALAASLDFVLRFGVRPHRAVRLAFCWLAYADPPSSCGVVPAEVVAPAAVEEANPAPATFARYAGHQPVPEAIPILHKDEAAEPTCEQRQMPKTPVPIKRPCCDYACRSIRGFRTAAAHALE